MTCHIKLLKVSYKIQAFSRDFLNCLKSFMREITHLKKQCHITYICGIPQKTTESAPLEDGLAFVFYMT